MLRTYIYIYIYIYIEPNEVFEKATTQHHFIQMYTELCRRPCRYQTALGAVQKADQAQINIVICVLKYITL